MKNAKVATRTAVICYGLGDLASQFVWSFVGSYLTIFYMDVVGLAPVVISAIMMGARIWDAVNDPIMGAIAERTRSKFGRFRPYIAFGCVPLAVFSVLTFTHPFRGHPFKIFCRKCRRCRQHRLFYNSIDLRDYFYPDVPCRIFYIQRKHHARSGGNSQIFV